MGISAVADPVGGARGGDVPPGPVKISHKKEGRRIRLHRFNVSRPLPPTRQLDPLLHLLSFHEIKIHISGKYLSI